MRDGKQSPDNLNETQDLLGDNPESSKVESVASFQPQPAPIDPESQLVAEYRQLHVGPLPHPDLARQYEDLLVGSFERILVMAEKEQAARLKLEAQRHQDTVSRDRQLYEAATEYHLQELAVRSRREFAGMWLGFLLAAGVLVIATMVIFTGRSLEAGIVLIIGDAVVIAGVFLHQARSSQIEQSALEDS